LLGAATGVLAAAGVRIRRQVVVAAVGAAVQLAAPQPLPLPPEDRTIEGDRAARPDPAVRRWLTRIRA
jgi:hypothetical protein